MVTTSLDDVIDEDNSVRVIDAYVNSLELSELGFIEYSGSNRGQAPYHRSDLLGYNYFLRRQMVNVDAEVASMFIAYNLKRLFTMFSTKELLKMIK
jgi:hypothetical protein